MKKLALVDYKNVRDELLNDPEVKAEYERLRPEFEVMCKLIKARKKAGLSQLELAEKLDLQQPAIARFERGGYTSTSISKLSTIANALGYTMKISFSAKKDVKKTGTTKKATTKVAKARQK